MSALTRILVVDDDQDIRGLLFELLTRAGFEVDEAPDGRTALRRLYEAPPSLVILDVSMPKMTGYEAGRVLSQQPPGLRPVLIAITAWPRDSGRLQAEMLAGFDHYVGKSRDATEILELVRRV